MSEYEYTQHRASNVLMARLAQRSGDSEGTALRQWAFERAQNYEQDTDKATAQAKKIHAWVTEGAVP